MSEIVALPSSPSVTDPTEADPWLKVEAGATRAKVSTKTIYTAVRGGRLRAARVGGRRTLRIRASWIDAWLEAEASPIEIPRGATFRVAR